MRLLREAKVSGGEPREEIRLLAGSSPGKMRQKTLSKAASTIPAAGRSAHHRERHILRVRPPEPHT